MNSKKKFTRCVSYVQDNRRKITPFIRLRGKWLEKLGFEIGAQFTLEVNGNQIILKVSEE